MRFSRPSPGTILGAVALFIVLGGTAFAAGATVVNIADPTAKSRVAHVNASGRLETAGSDSVTNTVNTELAAPSAYVHETVLLLTPSRGCVEIATPPTGKAMVVREVRINVYTNPLAGTGDQLEIYDNPNCSGDPVGDVNPAAVGETTLPFDPGLSVPAHSGLSAEAKVLSAEVYTDGYAVASSQVRANSVIAVGPR